MDNLIELYQQRLNLQKATFSRIDHDDAMVATVYRVKAFNGEEFVLKICTRTPDCLREAYFLKHLAGQVPVPRILQVVEREPGLPAAILMECLPGRVLKISGLTDELAYEIGTLLARIHLNRVEGYGDLIQPQSLSHHPHHYFTDKFEEGLEECRSHLPKELMDQCQSYFHAHLSLLDSVDGPCMTHRDFRPGNVIVNESKLQGIIDWSSARASFAEEDFCRMEFGEWSTDPKTKKSFLSGYATLRKVPDYTEIMPLLCLSKAIATIGFTVKRGTWATTNARVYQFNRKFLDTFF
jgi:aminoglycoside phosphotransferase (APT) family kinase protein